MAFRQNIVFGACWLLGGHRFWATHWRPDTEPETWVRDIRCEACGRPRRTERARGVRPLDIFSNA